MVGWHAGWPVIDALQVLKPYSNVCTCSRPARAPQPASRAQRACVSTSSHHFDGCPHRCCPCPTYLLSTFVYLHLSSHLSVYLPTYLSTPCTLRAARRRVEFSLLAYVPALVLKVHLTAAQAEKPQLQVRPTCCRAMVGASSGPCSFWSLF